MTKLERLLQRFGACRDGVRNAADCHTGLEAWNACQVPQHLAWACQKLNLPGKLWRPILVEYLQRHLSELPLEGVQAYVTLATGKPLGNWDFDCDSSPLRVLSYLGDNNWHSAALNALVDDVGLYPIGTCNDIRVIFTPHFEKAYKEVK